MSKVKRVTAFEDTKNLTVKKDESVTADGRPVFGIDLGTTNSAISVIREGVHPETIKLKNGKYTMPSCVMYHHGGFVVGDEAYRNREKSNVVYSVKRKMQNVNASVVLEEGRDHVTLTPAEVSAKILTGLVEHTDGMYGEIKDVVVTVPAYFDQNGINATRKACELAGLNLISIANEPTAASLCYDILPEDGRSKDVVIYDLGGGTFDATIARISNANTTDSYDLYDFDEDNSSNDKIISTLAIDGNAMLGGDDVDNEMLRILYTKLEDQHVNTSLFTAAYRESLLLRLEALKKEDAKGVFIVNVNTIGTDGREISANVRLNPEDFRDAFEVVYKKTRRILNRLLKSVPNNADTIVLVGGSTRNPWLLDFLKRDYPMYRIDNALDPDLSVSNGASIQGKIVKFGDEGVHIFDILPITIGIKDGDSVNPLVTRGTSLPTVVSSVFTTTVDNQEVVDVVILQGNSRIPSECVKLGVLRLDNIAPKPAGEPNLAISISISADRMMKCTATIDGQSKEMKLNLAGESNEPTMLTRKEKNLVRWEALANNFTGSEQKEFLAMLEAYKKDDSVKAKILAFIREHNDECK